MSKILMAIKIIVNGAGFVISYVSIGTGYYIPGVLVGIGMMLGSIIIPENCCMTNKIKKNTEI